MSVGVGNRVLDVPGMTEFMLADNCKHGGISCFDILLSCAA